MTALLGVLENRGARPNDKVSAARALLDNAFRAHDAFEVVERIEALEEAVKLKAEVLQ